MSDATRAYRLRLRKVLEHVDAHLDEDLSVESLARVAAFSKFHFHRQFSELFGLGVYEYVRLLRTRRASQRLAYSFRENETILEIALACGYESHEAFTRAFKKIVGQTPSEFRDHPAWEQWDAAYQRLREARSQHMSTEHRAESVAIVDFPGVRVAVLEHRGDPRRIPETVRAFIQFRRASGLSPRTSRTFNVWPDDPRHSPAESFRMELGVSIDGAVPPNELGIVAKSIPGGRCAVIRHVGPEDTLLEAVTYVYATWLPESGEELRDFPMFFERVRFPPEVPEHESVTDVFLPLR